MSTSVRSTLVSGYILLGLPHLHLIHPHPGRNLPLQTFPQVDTDILNCGGTLCEIRYIFIEELVVELPYHLLYLPLEKGQVHHHPGNGVNRTLDTDLDLRTEQGIIGVYSTEH